MTPIIRRLLLIGALVAAGAAALVGSDIWRNDTSTVMAGAENMPPARTVEWSDLLPDGTVASLPLDAATDFPAMAQAPRTNRAARTNGAGSVSNELGGDPAGRGLSPWPGKGGKDAANNPNAPRADLAGERVSLAGYMTPFNVIDGKTSTFLLVPYVGACIHVPAPPPNQIVLVETPEPVDVRPMWEPFRAVGELSVESVDTGLAEVGYTMELERMDPYDDAAGKLEGVRSVDDGD